MPCVAHHTLYTMCCMTTAIFQSGEHPKSPSRILSFAIQLKETSQNHDSAPSPHRTHVLFLYSQNKTDSTIIRHYSTTFMKIDMLLVIIYLKICREHFGASTSIGIRSLVPRSERPGDMFEQIEPNINLNLIYSQFLRESGVSRPRRSEA